jgi:hypothetical protein
MTEDHKLWPASNFPDRDENVNMFGSQGDVALYPRGPGLFITYDKSRYFGPDGIEQSYHFAKITKDLDKLYEIGRTFRREGGQKITIKLKE